MSSCGDSIIGESKRIEEMGLMKGFMYLSRNCIFYLKRGKYSQNIFFKKQGNTLFCLINLK